MTKREFLKQLRACLSQLNQSDRDQVLFYWSEAIDDRLESGMTEEEIFTELERPDIIALRVLSELYGTTNVPREPAAPQGPNVPQEPAAPQEPAPSQSPQSELDARRQELESQKSQLQSHIQKLREKQDETLEDALEVLEDELEALEDELEALEDEKEAMREEAEGLHFQINIPNVKIPDIKIPDIKIPDIKIPDIKLPDFSGENSRFHRRHLTAGTATVRQLRVIDDNNGVQIETSPDESIHLRWSENASHKYDVTGEGGILVLEHQRTNFLERMFAASRRDKVVVQLPAGFAGAVEINTTNASIKGEKLQLAGPVVLITRNAKIDLENVAAGQLRMDTSNAKLTLEKVSAEHIELHTSNAPISVERVTAQTLYAKTSNGAIKTEGLDAQAVDLTTSNGAISGELAGKPEDYSVESATSNGKNRNPTRPGGQRRLRLKTSNGGINLEFLG